MQRLRRFPDAVAAAQACGGYMLERLKNAVEARGQATLAISGGSSPRPMFAWLARSGFDWARVHVFWVDERAVPPDHSQSNFKLAFDAWLGPAGFPEQNVHRVQAELDPQDAATLYVAELRSFFHLGAGEMPRFDGIHMGLGPDAHTASLFPGEPLIGDTQRLAGAVWVDKMREWRITLLPGVLRAARSIAVLVCGSDKAQPLASVLEGPLDPGSYPGQIIARYPSGVARPEVSWFIDEAAAARLRAAV
jgi:6-phosphogluconolactonase